MLNLCASVSLWFAGLDKQMLRKNYNTIDSTNTQAAKLSREYPGQAVLVTAQQQTAGRGRTGRAWQSPVGGAWFSLAWPTKIQASDSQTIPLIAGLSVAQTLETILKENTTQPIPSLKLKWPNDVLLDGAKVCGILCEQTIAAQATTGASSPAQCIIIGIGINVNVPSCEMDAQMRMPPASVIDWVGKPLCVQSVIDRMADTLCNNLQTLEREGFCKSLHDALQDRLAWRGQWVSVCVAEQVCEGTLHDIDKQGRLIIETERGMMHLASGEVEHLTMTRRPTTVPHT